MHLSAYMLTMAVVVYCSVPFSSQQYAKSRDISGSEDSLDTTINYRRKRMARIVKTLGSAVGLGKKAAKKLLFDATEIPSENRHLRTFVKDGDYQKALGDFKAVHPQNVRNWFGPKGVVGKLGEVGDRTIVLTRGKYDKRTGRTVTIEIIKSKYLGSGIDKITYQKRKKQ